MTVPVGWTVTATVAAVQTGVARLRTHRPPTVTLLVTGDEVITAGTPAPGQVRDAFAGLVAALTLLEPLLAGLAGRPPVPLPTGPVTGAATPAAGGVRVVPVRCVHRRRVAGPARAGPASLHTAAAAGTLAVLAADWTDGTPAPLLSVP